MIIVTNGQVHYHLSGVRTGYKVCTVQTNFQSKRDEGDCFQENWKRIM